MANLSSTENYINDIETAQQAPVSEATVQRVGGSLNYCLDNMDELTNELAVRQKWYTVGVSNQAFSAGTVNTLLTFTVTLGANDAVIYRLGRTAVDADFTFATGVEKRFTHSHTSAGGDPHSYLYVKRDATVLQSSDTVTFAPNPAYVDEGFIGIDRPGAGTYTYTVGFNAYVTTCFLHAGNWINFQVARQS